MSIAGKCVWCILTVAALLLFPTVTVAQGTVGTTKAELQRRYTVYLTEEGYRPWVDESGNVLFKCEGRAYVIEVCPDDPTYFRLILPAIWQITSEAERHRALAVADSVTMTVKGAKVFIVGDYVWVSVELFLNVPTDFEGVFPRAIGTASGSAAMFSGAMRQPPPAPLKKKKSVFGG
jgi:hypothetical protein